MTTFILIVLAIFTYLVVGRIYANLSVKTDKNVFDNDDELMKLLVTIFYPVVILFKIVNFVGDRLVKIIF
jgi:hypothetical protein